MQRKAIAAVGALSLAAVLSIGSAAQGAILVSDNFDAATVGSGFALDDGVNKDINPPTATRLTSDLSANAYNLRYIKTDLTGKPDTDYTLAGNQLQISNSPTSLNARTSLSADGTAAFDFGSVLNTAALTPGNKLVYNLRISMTNNATGTQRMSLGWATVETSAPSWDFGVQLYHATGTPASYTLQKRFDSASISDPSATALADVNATIATTGVGAPGSKVNILVRVTDAGSESTAAGNSRIQVSLDDGSTFIYDSSTDAALPNGFKFDGLGRFLSLDAAGGNANPVLFDNLSIEVVPEPASIGLAAIAGLAMLRRRRA